MDNISDLIKIFSNFNNEKKQEIPKEISNQYPYGQFPIKYTRLGQESIRKQSENRYSYNEEKEKNNRNDGFDLQTLLPMIQLMTSGKKSNKDMMGILTKLLFKDQPELQKLFSLLPNNSKIKNQEIKQNNQFPDTNKVQISSLKRIN